jgi:hypothetical protein
MTNGLQWSQVWALDGKTVVSEKGVWDGGLRVRKTLQLDNPKSLPERRYHLAPAVKAQVVAEDEAVADRRVDDTDTQVSGQVVDQTTGRGLSDASVLALRPGVRV